MILIIRFYCLYKSATQNKNDFLKIFLGRKPSDQSCFIRIRFYIPIKLVSFYSAWTKHKQFLHYQNNESHKYEK